ncbi:MAG TPA: hypothetical protein VHD15_12095 [Hyphomicrobiales bacterium]|nr:hypothetical protein [Hyphomicrobiales bacterium]
MGVLTDTGLAAFLIIVVLIGGAGATLTARAVARAWRPWWRAVLWMVPLAAAVRFVQFALFDGTLLAVRYYAVDLAILVAIAAIAHRATRRRQMRTQYGWLQA